MINNQQPSVESTTNIPNSSSSTNFQPMINQLQQSVSDVSTLSSTTNSDS